MAVSVLGYFYFYGYLRDKALKIPGLQLFVSNVKTYIIPTSWKAWMDFCLENEVASLFSLRTGILPDGLMSNCLPLHINTAKGTILPPMASFEHCSMLWL